MLTRFRDNVRNYPRTFAAVLALTAVDMLAEPHRGLATWGVEIALTAVLAALVYVWFMSDSRRVGLLLRLLDNFEGRNPAEPCGFLMSVDHYGDEVRCTLPEGHEGGHLEEIETCVDENTEEEEIDAT